MDDPANRTLERQWWKIIWKMRKLKHANKKQNKQTNNTPPPKTHCLENWL